MRAKYSVQLVRNAANNSLQLVRNAANNSLQLVRNVANNSLQLVRKAACNALWQLVRNAACDALRVKGTRKGKGIVRKRKGDRLRGAMIVTPTIAHTRRGSHLRCGTGPGPVTLSLAHAGALYHGAMALSDQSPLLGPPPATPAYMLGTFEILALPCHSG